MGRRSYLWLAAAVAVSAAGLVLYSQTMAFAWDEGFHLLAAQLVTRGKRLYIDFVFSQTPLNTFWNALLFTVFGASWRVAHAAAALLTSGSILLTADYLWRRFPEREWRLAAALTAVILLATNVLFVEFGGIGQAYGFALFFLTAAFRFAIVAVERKSPLWTALAALGAATAANGTLLSAPALPVLLAWVLWFDTTHKRAAKCAAYLAAAAVPFIPLATLFAQSPRHVLFGIFEYNFYYRLVQWSTAGEHNIEVLLSWIDSAHALLFLFLGITGLIFSYWRSGWERARRAEFLLCALLAAALAAHISTAKPTFQRYYMLTLPFLAVLSSAGLYWLTRALQVRRAALPLAIVALVSGAGLGKTLYEDRDDFRWSHFEQISAKVAAVTPPGAALMAEEHIYFITGITPPSGLELEDALKLEFNPAMARDLHVMPGSVRRRLANQGHFDVAETCRDEEFLESHGLRRVYKQVAEIEDCRVFWDKQSSR